MKTHTAHTANTYREQLEREASALDAEGRRLNNEADKLTSADAIELRRMASRIGSKAEDAKLKLALLPDTHTPSNTKPSDGMQSARKNKLKPGNYWAAVWPNGRQLWGDTVRRNVERAAKGTNARIVQLPR